jgi:lipoprotein NlpD
MGKKHSQNSTPFPGDSAFRGGKRGCGRALAHHSSPITHHLLIALLFLSACSYDPPRTAGSYVVKRGDTLYSIAWRHGVDYKDLAKWNGIGRDYAIKPGQVLKFSPRSPPANATSRTATNSAPRSTTAGRAPPAIRPTMPSAGPPIQWLWPVHVGNATLTTRPNGGQGLTIAGTSGQEIRAAAAGRVVYTGSGLLGYGQLVIVKHNETYLSAYGHTKSVLVREQETVASGQSIATMGEGPSGAPMLYFEIRVNGRPTDPRPLLPTVK